jgi:hypothetical protein
VFRWLLLSKVIERGPLCIGHKHQGGAAVGYFAGLDVSLEETAICIVDDAGRIVREARAASDPDVLVGEREPPPGPV